MVRFTEDQMRARLEREAAIQEYIDNLRRRSGSGSANIPFARGPRRIPPSGGQFSGETATEGAGAARAVQSSAPSGALGSPESTEEATTAAAIQQYRGRPMAGVGEGGTLQPIMPMPGVGEGGTLQSAISNEAEQALARARADRQRQRNRPTTRMTPAASEADALNQRELDRIAAARGVLGGGDIQPPAERSFLDRLGLRRTNETGEGAPSTGDFMEDVRGLGRTRGMKKGGKVKKMAKGGVVKAPSASRRGDGIAARGKTKGRMV